jgi:hypothetical protein
MPALRLAAVAALALSLGGCAGLGLPFTSPETTASLTAYDGRAVQPILANAVITNQADPTDWDTIRRTIEGAPQGGAKLEWSNAITGSAGSLTVAADSGDTCRPFVTTINDFHGIRRYRGQACVTPNGRAQLRNVSADDATLT